MQSNVAELVKVGKLLLANEQGLPKYAGKTLDEIELSDIEGEQDENEELDQQECLLQEGGQCCEFSST